MARAVLTVQQISRDGIVPSYDNGDAVNGHEFANNGKTFLHVKNGGGSSINVTIQTPGAVDGLAVAERVVAVAAAAEKMIGPFPAATYNQAGGLVYVDLSAATSVTLDAFSV